MDDAVQTSFRTSSRSRVRQNADMLGARLVLGPHSGECGYGAIQIDGRRKGDAKKKGGGSRIESNMGTARFVITGECTGDGRGNGLAWLGLVELRSFAGSIGK